MKKQILDQAIQILQSLTDLSSEEFYFLLASFVMYFSAPLNKEPWNTFPKMVEQGKISVNDGLFMTDEMKNPTGYKKKMNDSLFENLIKTKKRVQGKIPFTSGPTMNDIVLVPDIIEPSSECTLFPKSYLKELFHKKIYTNELTGHPFAWHIVESINLNKLGSVPKRAGKKVNSESLLKYIRTEIEHLGRLSQCCVVCKCSSTKYKSLLACQCVYFCSLKCMEKWG